MQDTFHGRIPATPNHPAEREKKALVPRERVLSKQQKTVQNLAQREEEKSSAFAKCEHNSRTPPLPNAILSALHLCLFMFSKISDRVS